MGLDLRGNCSTGHRRDIIKCSKGAEQKQRISGRMPDKATSIETEQCLICCAELCPTPLVAIINNMMVLNSWSCYNQIDVNI